MKRLFMRCIALAMWTLVVLTARGQVYYGTYDNFAPEETLASILKKYEGKVVLVDLWATWCGPCRMGHKAMEPVKEELKDSDVVFVYLTGPTSDALTWREMIAGIPGEQYYLTKEQYTRIMQDNQSGGVPTYLLYDRQGQQVYRVVGFPGAQTLKDEITKALNE